MSKRKFFIDTDAGTDDAIALIMALRDENIDTVGISTSGGNVPLECVIQNVLYVCELCDQKIPVYRGAAQPIERVLGTADFIHGKDGLGDIGLDLSGRVPSEGFGPSKIVEAILANPHEIELVCLGPLTNICLAMQESPGILSMAKRIYIMGGLVDLPGNVTPLAEYNIWADPEAAEAVLTSDSKMVIIGWDTTLRSSDLSLEEVAKIRAYDTKYARFSVDIQGVRIDWMKEHGEETTVNIADALAMAVAMDDTLVSRRSYFKMSVRGGDDEDEYRGFIDATPSQNTSDIDYIHEVDRSGYMNLLAKSLK